MSSSTTTSTSDRRSKPAAAGRGQPSHSSTTATTNRSNRRSRRTERRAPDTSLPSTSSSSSSNQPPSLTNTSTISSYIQIASNSSLSLNTRLQALQTITKVLPSSRGKEEEEALLWQLCQDILLLSSSLKDDDASNKANFITAAGTVLTLLSTTATTTTTTSSNRRQTPFKSSSEAVFSKLSEILSQAAVKNEYTNGSGSGALVVVLSTIKDVIVHMTGGGTTTGMMVFPESIDTVIYNCSQLITTTTITNKDAIAPCMEIIARVGGKRPHTLLPLIPNLMNAVIELTVSSRDMDLPSDSRPALARMVASFHPFWKHLASKKRSDNDGGGGDQRMSWAKVLIQKGLLSPSAALSRVLAVAACLLPLLQSLSSSNNNNSGDEYGVVIIDTLAGLRKYKDVIIAHGNRGTKSTKNSMLIELCGHVGRMAPLASLLKEEDDKKTCVKMVLEILGMIYTANRSSSRWSSSKSGIEVMVDLLANTLHKWTIAVENIDYNDTAYIVMGGSVVQTIVEDWVKYGSISSAAAVLSTPPSVSNSALTRCFWSTGNVHLQSVLFHRCIVIIALPNKSHTRANKKVQQDAEQLMMSVAPLLSIHLSTQNNNANTNTANANISITEDNYHIGTMQYRHQAGCSFDADTLAAFLDWLLQRDKTGILIKSRSTPTLDSSSSNVDTCGVVLPGCLGTLDSIYHALYGGGGGTGGLLWFYVHEAARYLVLHQMKLPSLGTNGIEAMDCLHHALNKAAMASSSNSCSNKKGMVQGWLLIDFLFAQEQQIRNAVEGCVMDDSGSGNDPSSSSSSSYIGAEGVFFERNSDQVGMGWFFKRRTLLMKVSAQLGHHAMTVYHGLARLSDLGQMKTTGGGQVGVVQNVCKTDGDGDAAVVKKKEKLVVKKSADSDEASSSSSAAAGGGGGGGGGGGEPKVKLLMRPLSPPTTIPTSTSTHTAVVASQRRREQLTNALASSTVTGMNATTTAAAAAATVKVGASKGSTDISEQFIQVLQTVVDALIIMKDSETIAALKAHCTRTFSKLLSNSTLPSSLFQWMDAAVSLAADQPSQALTILQQYQSSSSSLSSSLVAGNNKAHLDKLTMEAYCAVSDWKDLQELHDQYSISDGGQYCYAAALASWDQGNATDFDMHKKMYCSSGGGNSMALPPERHRVAVLEALSAIATGDGDKKRKNPPISSSDQVSLLLQRMGLLAIGEVDSRRFVEITASREITSLGLLLKIVEGEDDSGDINSVVERLMLQLGGDGASTATAGSNRPFSAWKAAMEEDEQGRKRRGNIEALNNWQRIVKGCSSSSSSSLHSKSLQIYLDNLIAIMNEERTAATTPQQPQSLTNMLTSITDGSYQTSPEAETILAQLKQSLTLHDMKKKTETARDLQHDHNDGNNYNNVNTEALWRLAQYIHDWTKERIRSSRDDSTTTTMNVETEGYSLALITSCRALSSSTAAAAMCQQYQLMPILLQILRLMSYESSVPSSSVEVVVEEMTRVPSAVWTPILPQLITFFLTSSSSFASMRDVVGSILTVIEEASPCSVMLPVLVRLESSSSLEASSSEALQQLVESWNKVKRQKVEIFLDEMTSLMVLWEEHWESVLSEAHSTVSHAMHAMKEEMKNMKQQQQHKEIMKMMGQQWVVETLKPVIIALKHHFDMYDNYKPKTKHGKKVRKALVKDLAIMITDIEDLLSRSSSNNNNNNDDDDCGTVLEDVLKKLRNVGNIASRVGKTSSLSLDDVSPRLMRLFLTNDNDTLTMNASLFLPDFNWSIESVNPKLTIIHTKTRPKKLSFIGSDGRQHAFLLKGREDLGVDQRMMQFQRAAYTALLHKSSTGSGMRTFEVIPLCALGGLVEWVEDSIPLYQMYSCWDGHRQDKLAAVVTKTEGEGQGKKKKGKDDNYNNKGGRKKEGIHKKKEGGEKHQDQQPQQLQRQPFKPMNAFLSKLQAAGINTTTSPRSTWPLDTLRKVLITLMKESPRHLITNELLIGAATPDFWLQRQKTFTQSCAISSILGYLIGLGDRHLDNILFSRRSGGIVHIDFNVVLDRGARLGVPECVPFRLTPNFVFGMGVGGVYGQYKLVCEKVLRVMRGNVVSLGALLEVGCMDGGVNWGVEEGMKRNERLFILSQWLEEMVMDIKKENGEEEVDHSNDGGSSSSSAIFIQQQPSSCSISIHHTDHALMHMSKLIDELKQYVEPFLKVFNPASSSTAVAMKNEAIIQSADATLKNIKKIEIKVGKQLKQCKNRLVVVEKMLKVARREAVVAREECTREQQCHEEVVGRVLSLTRNNNDETTTTTTTTTVDSMVNPDHSPVSLFLVTPPPLPPLSSSVASLDLKPSIVEAALQVDISTISSVLSANTLLQASTCDTIGQQALNVLYKEAIGLRNVVELYGWQISRVVINNKVNNNSDNVCMYVGTSMHGRYAEVLDAALHGTGTDKNCGSCQAVISTTLKQQQQQQEGEERKSIKASAVLWQSLHQSFTSISQELAFERVDLTAEVTDTKQRLQDALISSSSSMRSGAGDNNNNNNNNNKAVLQAFASFCRQHAQNISNLTLIGSLSPSMLLDSLQHLVLGFATTAVTIQNTPSSGSSSSPVFKDNRMSWLAEAVQCVDAVGITAVELQLAGPPLISLLYSIEGRKMVAGFNELVVGVIESDTDGDAFVDAIDKVLRYLEQQPEDSSGGEQSRKGAAFGGIIGALQRLITILTTTSIYQENNDIVVNNDDENSVWRRVIYHHNDDSENDATHSNQLALGGLLIDLWREISIMSLLDLNHHHHKKEVEEKEALEVFGSKAAAFLARYVTRAVLPWISGRMCGTADGITMELAVYNNDGSSSKEEEEEEEEEEAVDLVPFTAFEGNDDDDDDDGGGLGGLEGELEKLGITGKEEERHGDDTIAVTTKEAIEECLIACCEATGSLAAIDAVNYVTYTALQQCQMQVDAANASLDTFEWLHSSSLLLLNSGGGGGATSTIAGSTTEDSVRSRLLGSMQSCIDRLQGAVNAVAHWKATMLNPACTAVMYEVGEILGQQQQQQQQQQALLAGLQEQQQWLDGAVYHCTDICRLAQGVLFFEHSRQFSNNNGNSSSSSGEWERYEVVAASVSSLVQQYNSIKMELVTAEKEMSNIEQLGAESKSAKQQAEENLDKATKQFNGAAFPLIKGTHLVLPDVLTDLNVQVTDIKKLYYKDAVLVLHVLKQVDTLASKVLRPSSVLQALQDKKKKVVDMIKSMDTLPAVLPTFSKELEAVQRELKMGGRGEAAAREQATAVVAGLEASIKMMTPALTFIVGSEDQEDQEEEEDDALSSLGSIIQQLREMVKEMVGVKSDNEDENKGDDEGARKLRAQLGMGLYSSVGVGSRRSPATGAKQQREERRVFASRVVKTFKSKVGEEREKEGSTSGDGEKVIKLISEATSVDRLCRMYEGWMPWV